MISVSDRGPGLTAEQACQIGQRFWRGDQGRKSKDGAGLGISIVRAIAERFGGALNLEPREGGGLVAKFLVPTDPAPKKVKLGLQGVAWIQNRRFGPCQG